MGGDVHPIPYDVGLFAQCLKKALSQGSPVAGAARPVDYYYSRSYLRPRLATGRTNPCMDLLNERGCANPKRSFSRLCIESVCDSLKERLSSERLMQIPHCADGENIRHQLFIPMC